MSQTTGIETGEEDQLRNLLNDSIRKDKIQIMEKEKVQMIPMDNKLQASKEKTGWKKHAGILLTLVSSVFFTLTIVVVKILGKYHPFCITFWRFLGILVPAVPITLFFTSVKKENVFGMVFPFDTKERTWGFVLLMTRGFLACSMVIARFYSLQYLTVADVSVISHTGPVFVTILAHFFLKEKCGVVSILVSIFTCFGVVVIMRPPFLTGGESFDVEMLIGAGLALLSTVCTCVVIILVRKQRKVHFSLMLLSSGIWGVGESWILAESFGVMEIPKGTYDLVLTLAVLPVLVFLAQLTIILALKFEDAGPVSLMRTCDVIFAFLWQIIFLSVFPDIYSIVGAAIVIVGVIITTLRTMLNTLPPEDRLRRRFRLLLL